MSDKTEAGRRGSRSSGPTSTSLAWLGWIAFAGTMLMLLGFLHVMQGLVALFNDEYYLVGKSGMVVHLDFTVWGWVHLIGGLVVMAAGLGVFAGQMWARVVGVIVAAISAIISVGFLAAYPFWSLIMVGLAVVVIMALTVHGAEIKDGA